MLTPKALNSILHHDPMISIYIYQKRQIKTDNLIWLDRHSRPRNLVSSLLMRLE